jgi:septal ring factor EnvC (AmiA/AmiB activator)
MNPRRAALPVSIACCMVLVAGVLAQPLKGPLPSGQVSPTPPPATGSSSATLQAVEGLVAEVRALTQDLEALIAQMRALLANRPWPPAAKEATDDEKKRYQKALDQWEAQVRQIEQAMDAKRQALDQALSRLNAATNQLPPDRRQAAESARKSAEQARAAAEKLLTDLRQDKSGATRRTRAPAGGTQIPPAKAVP